ncbi:MAG: type II toxin-antitoxin system PemK/MazF family toxin [Oscillospiraceae bacterium]|nr:type II toxin-antitoxin system PemK/MazF family toxin [Oscillospiraceae bacterium]
MVKQGDIIKIDLTPTKGHEQSGYRPVIVVNNSVHSSASNMTIVCPITNTNRNNPLHVELKGLQTTGFVMCDQIRAIDIRARNYKIVETVDEDTIWEICDIAKGSLDIVSPMTTDEISDIDQNEEEVTPEA